ncbi:MAG TPA: cation diffusion facilitator family transporter [Mariniphaga sp.]|nr:cation diffusion facilitator family transporter [Mariniphaga sp.]
MNREGWLSILGNTALFGLKYWAGIATGSLALIADAWHTLSDTISSIIVLIGGKISRKPADQEHPFGHGRAEHIATIIIALILAVIAFDFIIGAIEKLSSREATVFGKLAWTATIISIIAKEALAQYAFYAGKKTNSSILKADGWHHRSDALSSVVILIGIALGSKVWWMDAVLGFVVAVMIGWASYKILAAEIKSLLGESPSQELLESIHTKTQREFTQPLHLHHVHIHNYGRHTELSCHIKLPGAMSLDEVHDICTRVEEIIMDEFGFVTTVHAEPLA